MTTGILPALLRNCLLSRTFIIFIFFACISPAVTGQNAGNYNFSNLTNGSLVQDMNGNAISFPGGNLLTISNNSQNTSLIAIGFEFYFMGNVYTHFIAGNDGQLALGLAGMPAGSLAVSGANDLTRSVAYPSTAANNAAVLAPFWDDLATAGTSPTIRNVISGTAPNRCQVIEWNMKISAGSTNNSSADGSFQVRLYEGTGVVEYVYGKMTIGPSSGTVTASIGFTSGATNGSFLAIQDLSTFALTSLAALEPTTQNLVNSNVAGNITALHSTADGSRRVFRFTPPALIGTTPAALQVGGIGATCLSLAWPDNFSNESGYAVYMSVDNVNFNFFGMAPANTTLYTAYGLNNNTPYFWRVRAVSEGVPGNFFSGSGTTACTLNGTYSVGPGGQFGDLGRALDSFRIKGRTGDVVLELMPGYSPAGETFPIRIPRPQQMPCYISPTTQLTIRPAAGASNLTISGSSTAGMIILDSSTAVIIDGRPGGAGTASQLSIVNNAAGPVIQFINARGNTVTYVNISTTAGGAAGIPGLVNYSGSISNGSRFNSLSKSRISSSNPSAARNILLYSSATGGFFNDANTIQDCEFFNFAQSAIQLESGSNGFDVSGCSFYSTGPLTVQSSFSAIRYNERVSGAQQNISNNYFGGTGPQCSGGVMEINNRDSVQMIFALARTNITGNTFRRIKFSNAGPNGSSPIIHLISAGDPGLNFSYNGYLQNNLIGGATADSIHVTQNGTGSQMNFAGIFAGKLFLSENISGNNISNIRAYSPNGKVNLYPILETDGNYSIRQNTIGNTAPGSEIRNFTDGDTYGIYVLGINTIARVVDNRIQGIKTNGCSLRGIFAHFGKVDSITFNQVSHLEGCITAGNLSSPIYGISTQPQSVAGVANLVGNNRVFGLHNSGDGNGAGLSGIRVTDNSFIYQNLVHSLNSSSTGNTTLNGIEILNFNATVENNMIRLGLDTLGNSITRALGFIGINGGNLIKHNTSVIAGTNVTPGFSATYGAFFTPNAQSPFVNNNIWMNTRANSGPGGGRHACISYSFTSGGGAGCDYNLYYFTGPDAIIAQNNNGNFTSLAAWQASGTVDANSLAADPRLVNPSGNSNTIDLHLLTGSPAEARGVNNINFTSFLDYDGQQRSLLTPVDIGADAGNYAFPTGIDPVSGNSLGIRYFPNPVRDRLFLFNLGRNLNLQELKVLGADGKLVRSGIMLKNLESYQLSMANLPAGVFWLVISRRAAGPVYLKVVKY